MLDGKALSDIEIFVWFMSWCICSPGCVLPDVTGATPSEAGVEEPAEPAPGIPSASAASAMDAGAALSATASSSMSMLEDANVPASDEKAAAPQTDVAAGDGGSAPDAARRVASAPHCEATTCLPGGKCVDKLDGFTCNCGSAYSGTGTHECMSTRYVVQNETVRDGQTGLVWQRASSDVLHQSEHADYCANLSLDRAKWRVPRIEELEGLVQADSGPNKPTIDWMIFAMPRKLSGNWSFTSSTVFVPDDSGAFGDFWGIDFSAGERFWASSPYLSRVRCVR
jgi:hypothetical protein